MINMSFYKMFAKLNAVTNLISKIHVWIHKFQLTLHQVKKFYSLVHYRKKVSNRPWISLTDREMIHASLKIFYPFAFS